VIAIVGLLATLLFPAVQGAREAARRTQCVNQLKQFGVAMSAHEAALGMFPSNGWGWFWVGEPGRGSGPRQPGGWLYGLLGQLDQKPLSEQGRADTGAARRTTLAQVQQALIPGINCPSRRSSQLFVFKSPMQPVNCDPLQECNRLDYAVNAGDFDPDTPGGPATLAQGESPGYKWVDTRRVTGVSYVRSRVRAADVFDGLSNTYFVGEKYVSVTHYADGGDPGDDQSAFAGADWDNTRWTDEGPVPDQRSNRGSRRFGSAHPGVTNFLYGDGSVRSISFLVDLEVHRAAGNRRDGAPVR
jgi:prepilin-type processing-associated H-X9-DG protein